MVARIGYGKSISRILNYNENKVKEHVADLILANQFACEADDLSFNSKLHRFENMTMNNTRSKSNAIHISLNFDNIPYYYYSYYHNILLSYHYN